MYGNNENNANTWGPKRPNVAFTSRQNKVRSKMETMRQVRFVSLNLISTSCHLGENIKLDDRPDFRVPFVSC